MRSLLSQNPPTRNPSLRSSPAASFRRNAFQILGMPSCIDRKRNFHQFYKILQFTVISIKMQEGPSMPLQITILRAVATTIIIFRHRTHPSLLLLLILIYKTKQDFSNNKVNRTRPEI